MKYGVFISILYFALPYYAAVVPFLLIKGQKEKLKQPKFWLKSFIFLAVTGIGTSLTFYREFALSFKQGNPFESFFLLKVGANLKRIVPLLLGLALVKIFIDKKEPGFYGLNIKRQNYWPYFTLLLMMMPLIAAASFLPDFQSAYPRLKFWRYDGVFGMPEAAVGGLFEIAYAIDFVSVELLYRGALVIGLYKLLGKEVVLPMAAAYVFIHFGKPLGEAISSLFGGYILGVVAYRTKTIFSGIIIHIGVALAMELAATLQHYL